MDCKGGLRFPSRIGRRRPAALVIGMVLVAALALAPSVASASSAPARYVFEMCDSALPGGGDAGVSFAVNPGVPLTPSDNCSVPGGSLAITETGPVNATYSFWALPIVAPPGGTMESITISGARCGGGGTVAFVFSNGWPDNCAQEQRTIYQLNRTYGPFLIWLGCDGNYPGGCSAGPWIYAHYFATTEVDPVAPTLSDLQGSLLSGNVIRGHQDLSVDAHDQGGGIRNVSVSVNGLPAGQPKTSNCDVATRQQPERQRDSRRRRSLPAPPTSAPAGRSTPRPIPSTTAPTPSRSAPRDFATLSNPNTTCSDPQTVNVDNSCTNSPVGGGDVLSAQFAASNAEEVTVGYGQGAEVTGRLADNAGDPVSGATLCVKAQTSGLDPKPMPVGTVKTDAAGRYNYEVAPARTATS